MNTLNKEQELINLFVDALDKATDQNVTVISARDYTDDRTDRMVVVGVSNTAPVHADNPMLPDYDYTVDILIDCFIDNDKEGYFFRQTTYQVLDKLDTYFKNQVLLPQLFNDFPVVGMFLIGISNSTTEESNQTRVSVQVIASFDENL